jgi:hypothetical protein
MHEAEIAVEIVPSEDGAYTVVSAGEQVWRKKYASMLAATDETVELQIMTPSDKRLAVMSQPTPTYPQGFSSGGVRIVGDLAANIAVFVGCQPRQQLHGAVRVTGDITANVTVSSGSQPR